MASGNPVTEGSAGPSPVCPPATGTCESPSDTRISLSVDKLGLPLAGKQRMLTRSPDYSCTNPNCCSCGVARHFFGEQDTLNTHSSSGLWTLPWMGKTFDSRAFWKFPCVNKDVQCNSGFILKFLEAGPTSVLGLQIFSLMKLPNTTL